MASTSFPIRPSSINGLLLGLGLSMAACSPASKQDSGRVPGGTNQQEAINAAGDTGASNTMPGIGAPGTGGKGTQP
ncbi:hypothetical protein EP837_02722 [Sphingobium sp. EP60837]|nr:hypothetical protein EP837_02722 [Sphingobium sp. EP60837]